MFEEIIINKIKTKYKSLIKIKDVYKSKEKHNKWFVTFEVNGNTYTKRYDNLMKVKNIKKYIENGCTMNVMTPYLTPEIMKERIKKVHNVDIIIHDVEKRFDSQLYITYSLPDNPEIKYYKRYHDILYAKSIYNIKPINNLKSSYQNMDLSSLIDDEEDENEVKNIQSNNIEETDQKEEKRPSNEKMITDTMEKWKTLISKIDDLKKFAQCNFKDNFELDIGVKNVDSMTLLYFKDLLPDSKVKLDI